MSSQAVPCTLCLVVSYLWAAITFASPYCRAIGKAQMQQQVQKCGTGQKPDITVSSDTKHPPLENMGNMQKFDMYRHSCIIYNYFFQTWEIWNIINMATTAIAEISNNGQIFFAMTSLKGSWHQCQGSSWYACLFTLICTGMMLKNADIEENDFPLD